MESQPKDNNEEAKIKAIEDKKKEIINKGSRIKGLTIEDILGVKKNKKPKEETKKHQEVDNILNSLPLDFISLENLNKKDKKLEVLFKEVKAQAFIYIKYYLKLEIFKQEMNQDLKDKKQLGKMSQSFLIVKRVAKQALNDWIDQVVKLDLDKNIDFPERVGLKDRLRFLEGIFLSMYLKNDTFLNTELVKDFSLDIQKVTTKSILYRKIFQDILEYQKTKHFIHPLSFRIDSSEVLAKTFSENYND